MKLGRNGPWPYPEGMALSFLDLATRRLSLFCNPNTKLAVLGVSRGQIAKIRPFFYENGG